jgi:hypothetical protein
MFGELHAEWEIRVIFGLLLSRVSRKLTQARLSV